MTKFTIKFQKIILVFLVFIAVFIAFELKAKKEDSCEFMVDDIIKQGIPSELKSVEVGLKKINLLKEFCWQSIKKTGDHKELYAYYKIYNYVDRLNEDKGGDNIYHWMLFYANQNSRDFDEKTQSFKKEKGLYEQELKDFEDQMTQEEKIKSFSYIADNLAAGKEGWVKKNDYEKSFEYLKRAAEAGDVKSQAELGACYFVGVDWMNKFAITKNYIESYKWLYLSTIHSNKNIRSHNIDIELLKKIKVKMSSKELIESSLLINDWILRNQEFIKSHPLNIIQMTDDEIKKEKEKTEKFIKDYKLN